MHKYYKHFELVLKFVYLFLKFIIHMNEKYVSEEKDIKNHEEYNDPIIGKRLKKSNATSFREVKKDGNCLYLSVGVQLVDLLKKNEEFRVLFRNQMDTIVEKFKENGYEEFVYSDYIQTIYSLSENDIKIDEIEGYSWYEIVGLMRLITGLELKSNKEIYKCYLIDIDVDNYVKTNVDPFYIPAGYIEIGALVNILPVNVEVTDVSRETNDYTTLYGNNKYKISILHTPNHFEPLNINKNL